MSAKTIWPCALVLAVLGVCVAPAQERTKEQAQERTPRPQKLDKQAVPFPRPEAVPQPPLSDSAPPVTPSPKHGELSSWIKYGRPGCCDPYGADGPIFTELYVRAGPSLPVAGGVLNNTLALGWMVMGGGRSLFFNPEQTAAWTVDLSLSHIVNNGNQLNLNFPLNPGPDGSARTGNVRNLHRTMFGAGLGREWYLNGAANDFQHYWALWRFGLDAGFRLGTARTDFNELRTGENFQRTHDVFWAGYFALHTDVEIPCGGCCVFHTGFRTEWQYSWLDVFPVERRGNLQDLSFLWSIGVRF